MYTIVAVALFGGLFAAHALGVRSVRLACWSGGYAADGWMAYCNSTQYGVYDVDAIWFQTEDEVATAIQNAQVLTLSDSRLQNALSLGGAPEWFRQRGYDSYLLGLPTEESGFGEKLLEKFKPRAGVVILDASPYFTGKLGFSETGLSEAPEREHQEVLELKDFQTFHQRFCTRFTWFCGHTFAYFRSRRDGHWIFPTQADGMWFGRSGLPNDDRRFPTNVVPDERVPLYSEYLAMARRLVDKIGLPKQCIVLTHVPNDERGDGLANFLASSLGIVLIDPQMPDLYTFDRTHLTPRSSAAWTSAFLQALEPTLKNCLPLPAYEPRT